MAGLLEELLRQAQMGVLPLGAGFPPDYDASDPAAVAAQAREAAAARFKGGVQRPGPPLAPVPGIQFPGVGLLGAMVPGTDMSGGSMQPAGETNAMPPVTGPLEAVAPPAPMPRERDAPLTDSPSPSIMSERAAPYGGVDDRDLPYRSAGVPTDLSATARAPLAISPPPAAAAGPASPAGPGFGGKLWSKIEQNSPMLLALGAGLSGAPTFGQGLSRAFAGAGPAIELQRKNALQQSGISETYKALVGKGVPPAEALAAVYNPDVMKAVVAKHFDAKPLQHVMIKNAYGPDTPAVFNQTTGKYTDAEGNPLKGGGSAVNTIPENYDPVTGRDEGFLKTLGPVEQAAVKAAVEGRILPTGRNLQQIIPLAARYENGFSQADYSTRLNTAKAYTSGEGAKQMRQVNTVINHGLALEKAIDDLRNFETLPGALNPVTGAVAGQFSPRYQKALNEFKTNADLFSRELDVALTGKSTVSGQKEIRQLFDPNASPVALKGSLHKAMEMLGGRMEAHHNTFAEGMKSAVRDPEAFAKRFISPGNAEALPKLMDRLQGGTAAPSITPAPAVAPAPGRYVYDPLTRQMKLAQ